MVEQRTCNAQAVGSSPIGGSMVFLAGITYNENNPPEVRPEDNADVQKSPDPRAVCQSFTNGTKLVDKDGKLGHYSN